MKNPFQIILILILMYDGFIHPQDLKHFYTIRDSISKPNQYPSVFSEDQRWRQSTVSLTSSNERAYPKR